MTKAIKKVFLALIVAALISCSSSTGEDVSPTSMAMSHNDSHDSHDSHDHDHGNNLDVSQLVDPPTVSISGRAIETGEVNLNFSVENLELIPINPPSEHESGQGHLHLYVDGVSVAMLHEASYVVTDLTKGLHDFRVAVSTNDHREYYVDGKAISDSISIEIEEGEEAPEVDKGITVEVKNGTVVDGLQRLTVDVGEQVSITLLSDEDDVFHLHAYNLEVSLTADQPEILQFQADIPGVFEGELHEAGYQILALEVS